MLDFDADMPRPCPLQAGRIGRPLKPFAVRDNHDERHLLNAALLAHSSGTAEDAVRLAQRVASSTDAVRRRTAREILIDAASRREDWDAVLDQTRRLIAACAPPFRPVHDARDQAQQRGESQRRYPPDARN